MIGSGAYLSPYSTPYEMLDDLEALDGQKVQITSKQLRSALSNLQKNLKTVQGRFANSELYDDIVLSFQSFEIATGAPAPFTGDLADPQHTLNIITSNPSQYTQDQKNELWATAQYLNTYFATSPTKENMAKTRWANQARQSTMDLFNWTDEQMDAMEELFKSPQWQQLRKKFKYDPDLVDDIQKELSAGLDKDKVMQALTNAQRVDLFVKELKNMLQ